MLSPLPIHDYPTETLWRGPRPIAEAPIRMGVPYGPCLLAPGIDGNDWVIGEWNGEDWWNLFGDRKLAPLFFLLLPPLAAL